MLSGISLEQLETALDKFNIPPRPDILNDIRNEMEAPDPDIKRLAALIDRDKGLSVFTLKVVNSPLFSLRRKVTSIEHACNFLGMNRVVKLVQSIVLRLTLSGDKESSFEQRIWNSSADVALAMALLAKDLGYGDSFAEDCFLVGQFHNAGMAMANKMIQGYPRVVQQAYQQRKFTIAEYEEHEVFSSHEVLGYLIANKWELPDLIVEVITYHHNHELMLNSGIQREERMFALLKLSEHLIGLPRRLVNVDVDVEWERHGTAVLGLLNADESQLKHFAKVLGESGVNTIYM